MNNFPEPSCHSYLGDNLHDVSRFQSILQYNHSYDLLLIPLQDVVLFPNETLPLRLQNPKIIEHIRTFVTPSNSSSNNRNSNSAICHLGIVNITYDRAYAGGKLAGVGTSIEIRATNEFSADQLGPFNIEEIILTTKGRNRFKILKTTQDEGLIFGNVKILPDEIPRNVRNSKELKPFPSWVYLQNQPELLAREVFDLFSYMLEIDEKPLNISLIKWGPIDNESISTEDKSSKKRYRAELNPNAFSYFISSHLSVSTEVLQFLLEADNVIDRLRKCRDFLIKTIPKRDNENNYNTNPERGAFVAGMDNLSERNRRNVRLGCSTCGQFLALKSDVFTVPGAEGMVGAYVNPHGAVHQTVTLRKLAVGARIYLQGEPTARDSWFPGYSWTIVSCQRCFQHLGWHFRANSGIPAFNPRHEYHHMYDDGSDDDDGIDIDFGSDLGSRDGVIELDIMHDVMGDDEIENDDDFMDDDDDDDEDSSLYYEDIFEASRIIERTNQETNENSESSIEETTDEIQNSNESVENPAEENENPVEMVSTGGVMLNSNASTHLSSNNDNNNNNSNEESEAGFFRSLVSYFRPNNNDNNESSVNNNNNNNNNYNDQSSINYNNNNTDENTLYNNNEIRELEIVREFWGLRRGSLQELN